jgi:hypothetical protein
MSFSNLFVLVNVAFGECPVANPDTSAMNTTFKDHYDNTPVPEFPSGGSHYFKEYVEQCQSGDNPATSSNEYDQLQFAKEIGGTTMFYNDKSHHKGLNIYGGDLLVIPSNYFRIVNDAKNELDDNSFQTLISALVESGLYQAIRDGDKGKNNWPTVNSVLTDSDTTDHDTDHLFFCLHLEGHISVEWMHMHIFQSAEWRSNDDLWNEHATCTKLQKPADGPSFHGWEGLLHDEAEFNYKVQQLVTCLIANYGDGNAGLVDHFDTCGQDNRSLLV